jgi:hypothetical protein
MPWVELICLEDAELLGRRGPSRLAGILETRTPFLARQHITPLNPGKA